MAPEPDMLPAEMSESKSYGNSSMSSSFSNVFTVGTFALEFEFFSRLKDFGGRASGNHGFEFSALAQSTAERGVVDQLAP